MQLGLGNTAEQRGLYRQSTHANHIQADEVEVRLLKFADGTSATTMGPQGPQLRFATDMVNRIDGGSMSFDAETGVVTYTRSPEVGNLTTLNVSGTTTTTQINSVHDYASDVSVNSAGRQMSVLTKFIAAPHVKIGVTLNSSNEELYRDNPHSGNQDGGNSRVDVTSKFITFNAAGLGYTSTQFGHAFFTTGSGPHQHISLNQVNIHTGTSDDRIKFNETRVTDGLDVINQINIYSYDKVYEIGHTPQNNPYRREIGVIAQEIQQIPQLASCVSVNQASPDAAERFPNGVPMSVYYDQIHSYHIRATQELHQLVQSQQQLIANLEARLVALESPAS